MTQGEFKFMHTPGPWKIVRDTSSVRFDGFPIRIIAADGTVIVDGLGPSNEANAYLIAAAPRMFEALGRLEATVSDLLDRNCITDDIDATYADAAEARAAIADATEATEVPERS